MFLLAGFKQSQGPSYLLCITYLLPFTLHVHVHACAYSSGEIVLIKPSCNLNDNCCSSSILLQRFFFRLSKKCVKSTMVEKIYLQGCFGSKYSHRTVKLFAVFRMDQSYLSVLHQSELSPLDINPFVT